MSISRLSFHYFSAHQQQIIRGIKNAEKISLANPADTCTKIFLEYQYPKTVVIARPSCISVYPYSPQLGQSPYWGWLKFNTRKNTYAQKSGSLLVMEDGPSQKIRLELWKNGIRIEFLDCSFADMQGADVDKFLSVYHEFNQTDSLSCSANYHSMLKKDILNFSQLQEVLSIPLFLPDDWQHTCEITEESQLLIIAKRNQ